jgi:hypothetical protein
LIAFVVDGAPYVAKRRTLDPSDPEGAAREITCLRIASERGEMHEMRREALARGIPRGRP